MDSYLSNYQSIILDFRRQPQCVAYVCKNIRFDDNSCAFDGICAFAFAYQNVCKMAFKINNL